MFERKTLIEQTINKHIATSLEATVQPPWKLKPSFLGDWSLSSL